MVIRAAKRMMKFTLCDGKLLRQLACYFLFGLALLCLMNGKPVVKATKNWLCCLFNALQ